MNSKDYQYECNGNGAYLKYFSDYSMKKWSFPDFEGNFQNINILPSTMTLATDYSRCLKTILNSNKTPKFIEDNIRKLLKQRTSNAPCTTYINRGLVIYCGNNSISIINIDTELKINKNITSTHGEKRKLEDEDSALDNEAQKSVIRNDSDIVKCLFVNSIHIFFFILFMLGRNGMQKIHDSFVAEYLFCFQTIVGLLYIRCIAVL
ncbi:MAG: hypothetical protein EXX96DRAFT_576587 [Benjaminiella poitrasii]|nr:MAG: hypothetical protein EXX96DRAFT_576587 [Benjaminiella poitrasii]